MKENLEYLIKRLNTILKNNRCNFQECINILKSVLASSEAERIFGGWFADVCVFRFSKHLYPTISIDKINGQKYISGLSFVYYGNLGNGLEKTENMNKILSTIDYEYLAVNSTPFDFSIIENIKF